jgi:hypothetical protein
MTRVRKTLSAILVVMATVALTVVPARASDPSPADRADTELRANIGTFLADYTRDRYLLEPRNVLTNPVGLMFIDRYVKAINDAKPKTCVAPEAPKTDAPKAEPDTKQSDAKNNDNPDAELVLVLVEVMSRMEEARRKVLDLDVRDRVMKGALDAQASDDYVRLLITDTIADAITLREFRLEADAAVDVAIALDRFFMKNRFPVPGPINPVEAPSGLALFDRVLEQVEDGFAALIRDPTKRADLARFSELEARRTLALLDLPADRAHDAPIPLRPKVKHVTGPLPAVDTPEIWEPLVPLLKKRCIEPRTQRR